MPNLNPKFYNQRCTYCKKRYYRTAGRYNEAKKFNWKPFCSLKCLGLSARRGKIHICHRIGCDNRFWRTPSDKRKSRFYYCSARCSALVNNKLRPVKPKKRCVICNKEVYRGKFYCSPKCQYVSQIKSKELILGWIKDFYKDNTRIPLKRESAFYHAARNRFGSWNKAIVAAGFEPNPVMFAKKYIANDGHKCDSLAERIIDDWLFRRKIKHKIHVPYPNNEKFSADFVIDNIWIEFFGLSGELKRYDFLKRKKLHFVKKLGINLISVYPKDLYPKSKLNEVLQKLLVQR